MGHGQAGLSGAFSCYPTNLLPPLPHLHAAWRLKLHFGMYLPPRKRAKRARRGTRTEKPLPPSLPEEHAFYPRNTLPYQRAWRRRGSALASRATCPTSCRSALQLRADDRHFGKRMRFVPSPAKLLAHENFTGMKITCKNWKTAAPEKLTCLQKAYLEKKGLPTNERFPNLTQAAAGILAQHTMQTWKIPGRTSTRQGMRGLPTQMDDNDDWLLQKHWKKEEALPTCQEEETAQAHLQGPDWMDKRHAKLHKELLPYYLMYIAQALPRACHLWQAPYLPLYLQ